jgi:hypothetical protein
MTFYKFFDFSTDSLLTKVLDQMIMKVRGKISATGKEKFRRERKEKEINFTNFESRKKQTIFESEKRSRQEKKESKN